MLNTDNADLQQNVEKEKKWGIRHVQAILLFLLIAATTGVRTSLNIAVIAMSQNSNYTDIQVYDWNKEIHGYILSSVSWGNAATHIIAGVIIGRYGGKIFISLSVLLTSIFMIIVPWSASLGDWEGVCVVMSLQGLCQGFMYPAVHALLGRWAPVDERTRLGMFIYSGLYFGAILTPSIAASIGSSKYGWPFIFYLFGGQTLGACLLWMIYGSDSPSTCSRISDKEKEHIEKSLNIGNSVLISNVPWKSIFTSLPFYALVCAQIGGNWGFMTIYNETPSYLTHGLNIQLQNSGYLTSVGFLNGLFFTFLASWISDYIHNKNYLTLTSVRKLCNTIGCWGPAIFFLTLAFLSQGQDTLMVVALIMVAGLDGISSCGFMVNHIDLSPKHAGILVGIACTIAETICLLEPIVTGHIIGDDLSNLHNWRYVFIIGASMYFFGNIVFVLFGSGETQYWNNSLKETEDDGIRELELMNENREEIH